MVKAGKEEKKLATKERGGFHQGVPPFTVILVGGG
jgi:hypothetical protein